MQYSEAFILSVLGIGIICVQKSVRDLFKKRCKKMNCCCFSVENDTEAETKENLERIDHGTEFSPRLSTPVPPINRDESKV